jgi:imidazoleglycerol-phosphate dehydratase
MRASFRRDTAETEGEVSLDLAGPGSPEVETGVPLLDEILKVLARGSGFDLQVRAAGDLPTGDHHTVEDVAIALGQALAGMEVAGIGSSFAPSGEALAFAAVRFGAPGYQEEVEFSGRFLEGMDLATSALHENPRLQRVVTSSEGHGGVDWQKVEALASPRRASGGR